MKTPVSTLPIFGSQTGSVFKRSPNAKHRTSRLRAMPARPRIPSTDANSMPEPAGRFPWRARDCGAPVSDAGVDQRLGGSARRRTSIERLQASGVSGSKWRAETSPSGVKAPLSDLGYVLVSQNSRRTLFSTNAANPLWNFSTLDPEAQKKDSCLHLFLDIAPPY